MNKFQASYSVFKYITQSPSNKGQKLYRMFLGLMWQLYKRVVRLPIISKLDNKALFVLEPNSTNSTGNIYVKTYEAEYIYFLRKNLIKGGYILDIGAHMGLYTLLVKDLFLGGYCFEPAADNFRSLKANLFLNEMLSTFIPINMAVSDEICEKKIIIDGIFSGTNKISDSDSNGESVIIKCTKIDSYLASEQSLNITFIKIDTEGHELSVLTGAVDTLMRNRSVIVLCENSDTQRILDFFTKIDFKVFSISNSGQIKSDFSSLNNAYNLFAVGNEHPLFVEIK